MAQQYHRREHWAARAWPFLVLIGCFIASRVAWFIAGVRYDNAPLSGKRSGDLFQLLDVHLLRDHLVESVWHLNSQPPLFNLYCGLIVKLPHAAQLPFEEVCALLIGMLIVIGTYLLLVELRVPSWLAVTVTVVFVVASPSYILFENWLTYAYPSAALVILSALCLIRYLRRHHSAYGVGFFGSTSALVLLNSTYQVEWLVVASAAALLVAWPLLRRHRRQVAAVAVVPVIAVAVWCTKDAVMFGTSTTSSWVGMNLGRVVLYSSTSAQIETLQQEGKVSALTSILPFARPGRYVPRFVHLSHSHSGVPALDQVLKADGAPNYNDPLYISISSQYLHDDIAIIQAYPATYFSGVATAARVWFTPSDQAFLNLPNFGTVRGFAQLYDHTIEVSPQVIPAETTDLLILHQPPAASMLSYLAVVTMALTVLGAPLLVWRRRKDDPAAAATMTYLWVTVVFAFVATSMLEIGENERFRFELGPVPLVVTVAVLTAACRALWNRRRGAELPVDRQQDRAHIPVTGCPVGVEAPADEQRGGAHVLVTQGTQES